MIRCTLRRAFLFGTALALLVTLCLPLAAQTSEQVEVRRGKVVYVSGNDLVVKMADGSVKHFTVPADASFTIDGKKMGVTDLKPGMELTQTITTTTTNKTVSGVRTVTGTVFEVNAPYVIITVDGKNRQVKVPDGTKFDINGQKMTVFDLKPGMKFTATIATKTPETIVSRSSNVTGTAPPPPPAPVRPVQTPQQVGVLLVEEVQAPVQQAAAAPPPQAPAPAPAPAPAAAPERLPATGSPVPLAGLIGALSLSAGLALRYRRRS